MSAGRPGARPGSSRGWGPSSRGRPGRLCASELPYAPVGRPVLPRRVAKVDDEGCALRELLVVDAGMCGHDGDAVGIRQGAVQLLRGESVLRELGHMRIVVGKLGALVTQKLDELQRRRLAQVSYVDFVGDTDEVHAAALDRFLLRVEGARDLLQAEVGHVLVDLAGQLDELGVEVELARLPG